MCFAHFSFAQKGSQTPDFQGKEIKNVAKNELEQRFEKYEVFEIPTKALSRSVKGKSTTQFELQLGKDRNWKMTLFESNLYGENYVTRVMTENGVQTVPRAENAVFKGFLNDDRDNEIRLTIAEGFVFGYVTDGEKQYYIEPLKHHNKMANPDHFVMYTPEDVIPIQDAQCGVKDVDSMEEDFENLQKSADLACLEMELAQAADYGMFQKYGSVANLNLYMDGIMNAAAANYDNEFLEQIIVLISERYIVACDGCDPWVATGDYNALLPDFQNWALGSTGFTAPHDLRCLWTTRDIGNGGPGSAVGVADVIGGVCLTSGNTIFEDFSATFSDMRVVAAHELGHLFGCAHNYEFGSACDGNPGRGVFIMDPMVTSATTWSNGSEPCTLPGGSYSAVNNHVATRPCMTACVGTVCENTFVDGVDIANISGSTIDLIWNASATNYDIRARTYGTSTWTYTNTTTSTGEFIPGLMCDTEYEVQVRADCGGGLYGPPTTVSVRTTGLNIDNLNVINCGGGVYDLEIIIDTDNAAAGSAFDITIDGSVFPQTYDGTNPQVVVFSGLPADGVDGISVTVGDASCTQSSTYDSPPLECMCTVIQAENFDACTLPAGWTNNALGTPGAEWQFGPSAGGASTPAGSIDGTCMAYFDDDAFDQDGGEIAQLISPPIDLTNFQNIDLEFDYNFWVYTFSTFSVDVFDGTTWVNVLTESTFACGPWGSCTPPHAIIPIDAYINQNFQVRFTYDDFGSWEWLVALDNFSICGFSTGCNALNPNFAICKDDESNYDLTQQDLFVNPAGENVTWYDGQPASGTATDLSPATAVNLTMVDDLWALVSTADSCLAETQVTYVISPQLTITSSVDTLCTGGTADICVAANLPATAINWTDDAGNAIGTTSCVTVTPTTTTTYTVAYTDSQGCAGAASTTISLFPTGLPSDTLDVGICEADGLMNFDLTQYNSTLNGGMMGTPTVEVDWYDGQPSAGGTDITPTADATDLTGMPSIWALITDLITNCTQEVLLNYGVDNTPQITCPADVVTSSDPDTCGAFVALPLAVVMDDSLTLGSSPTQTIQLDFSGDEFLTFNFNATNIDPTQPVSVDLTIIGNLSTGSVIFNDEVFALGSLGAADCVPNTASFTYTAGQIAPMLADGVFVMNADVTGTSTATCPENYVLITITYTPIFDDTYLIVTNDFNSGGLDASGFYPPGTTIVTYIATDACGNSDTCAVNVTVNQDFIQGEDFFFTACGGFMDFDLTQFSADFGNGMGTPTDLVWYDGQPSMGGTNITADADSIDLTTMPDVWVQITDPITGCPTEVNLMYELDAPPQVTCPSDISVGSEMGICGANVTIPPIVVTDDSITALPDDQTIFVDYAIEGSTLQFDFIGTNIDQTQPATLTIIVSGDIGLTSEYYDIFDENGNFFAQLGNDTSGDCNSETSTFTISVADLSAFLADNIMTFTAIPTSSVNTFCDLEGIEMNLTYTPLTVEYLVVTNDYTNGGADASGFYPSGTTTVTYTATDGCGNATTCSVDVTVSPGTTTGFFNIEATADTLCPGGSADLCLDIPTTATDGLYAMDLNNVFFSDIALYDIDPNTSTITPNTTFAGADIGGRTVALDLNPANNTMYLMALVNDDNAVRNLYTFDLTAGILSDLGQVISTGGNVRPQAMSFNAAGDLYAIFQGGELHQIDYTTSPITTTFISTLPSNGGVGLSYNYENNTLLYSTGQNPSIELYEVNYNTGASNLLMTFTTPSGGSGCTSQGLEYYRNGLAYSTSTLGCNEIYLIDINSNTVSPLLSPTGTYERIKDLLYIPGFSSGNVVWTDDSGNQIDTTACITVMPSMTTTYTATYTLPNGCIDVSDITIATTGMNLAPTTYSVGICESEDITAFDLTQYNSGITADLNENVDWYIGQPSMGGTDITATADSTDLTGTPDIWALITNSITNCMQEVNLIYQIDNSPTISCPAAITVNNDPDTCGAFVSIPLATAMDDNVNALPDLVSLRLDFIGAGLPLLFDFDGTNIDPNQAVTVTVTAFGDLDSSLEYYEIFDENGTSLIFLNGLGCFENVFTYTIPAGDVAAFLADNTISFTATPTTSVDPLCPENYVEIELAYGSFAPQFTNIINDYNDGGADASGFYLPGTTTVTYVAFDGCGNTDTCTVDITVIQEITQEPDLSVTTCGDLMNFDLTQFNFNFGGGTMGTPTNINVDWYEGQPSMSGMDIPNDSTDLTTMPDIWALLTDTLTGCPSEVNLIYEFDLPPTITCPMDITVNADAGVCGANVTIPLATTTDDGVTPIPQGQTIYQEYFVSGPTLQFDFSAANIDLTQPATMTVTAFADMGDFSETFDIFDENGNMVLQLGNNVFSDCQSETGTFTISAADLASFAADNVISFTAIGSTQVDAFCVPNAVEMVLDYTPLVGQTTIITNDYNAGGPDASGFYPSGTTLVTYVATDGCGNTDTCTVAVNVIQPPITGSSYLGVFCGDPVATDITQFDSELINNPGDVILWFDGQPSAGGVDITATAMATDISGMPDLWVQIIDELTGCIEERDILYFVDTPPMMTCPGDITVDADAGVCGADISIPAVIVTDDNITPLPTEQVVSATYTTYGETLQFDFDATNLNTSQPASVNIVILGDTDFPGEYYDIFDENGTFITIIGETGTACEPLNFTYDIPVADLGGYAADGVITFTAIPTLSVDFFCTTNSVEMELVYAPLNPQFINITNDYNNGGADASDFYPSGTTTVTFTATDGCGNVSTCSVDVTVDQVPIPATVEVSMDTICLGQSTELCLTNVNFGTGQLLGLNTNGTWIGSAFDVSGDLSTVTDDPNFVVPPIQSPAPFSGAYFAMDYNPADGMYYMLAENPSLGVNLYSVDITTGVTTDLGFVSDNQTLYALGMTFDNAGNLYLAIVTTLVNPFITNIEVIPAGMLTAPVPTPTFLGSVPWLSGSLTGMTYNFDDNTIYYSTGSTQLYELDLSGNTINGPVNYTSPIGCAGQSIEYVGNGILFGGACSQIYPIDPITGTSGPALAAHSGNFSDLVFVPSTEITWTDDSGNVVATGTETCIDVMPDQTTTYTASYVSSGCIYEGSATVTVLDLSMDDAVTLTDPGSTCIAGNPLNFVGSPDGGVFTTTATAGFTSDGINSATLNPAEAGVGMYDITYTYTNDIGCVGEVTVMVEIYDQPAIMVSSNSPVCADESLQLVETGGAAVSWSWTSDGTATFDDTTAQSPVASGTSDGETFTVTITDINGCTATSSTTATILSLPIANDPQLLFCPNEDISGVNLIAENTNVNPNAGPTSVTWYDGDPDSGGILITPADNVDLNTIDDLWALMTDDNGCSTPVNVGIFFYPGMTFAPVIEVPTCADDDSGSITLNISGGVPPYDYAWTSEDGSGSGTGDVVTDLTIGAYNITVTDGNGCSETTSVEIAEESCFFTITNSFLATDPCRCNADQTENGAGDGTFTEVVTVVGAPGLIIRASENSTGLSTGAPVNFYESFPGRYRLDFTHVDRVGYVIYVEFSEDGGQTFLPATDENGMQLVLSNVCAYPVLNFIPPLTEFCETQPEFTIDVQEISPDVDFIALPGYPSIVINNGFQIPAPITFDPEGLGGSTFTFSGFYNYQPGTGVGGTLEAPAISLNACPTYVRVNVPINDEPVGEAICGPSPQANNEAIIDVDPMEDYPTIDNLMYRLDNGPFQTNDKFTVNSSGTYALTIMDMETACTYEFEVACSLVLPIELTGFEATCDDGQYVLEWKTATEENVLEFVVERSTNGVDFIELGKVIAVGNSTTPQTYTYRDETAQVGSYYYRLRIVEGDGKETLSRVETAACLKGVFDIVDVFPNPTDDELTILFETINTDDINFKLTDVLGRTIMEENITPAIGLNTKVIDLSDLASAVYFVVMDDGRAVRKVVRK